MQPTTDRRTIADARRRQRAIDATSDRMRAGMVLDGAMRAYDAAPMARETERATDIARQFCQDERDSGPEVVRVYAESAEQDAAELIAEAGCETPAARWFVLVAAIARYLVARHAECAAYRALRLDPPYAAMTARLTDPAST